jgi:phosphate transport system permease protein
MRDMTSAMPSRHRRPVGVHGSVQPSGQQHLQSGPVTSDKPRTLTQRTLDDRLSLVSAAAGALAIVWIIYDRLLPFSGTLGFLICWYVTFVGLYTALTSLRYPRPIVIDRVAQTAITGCALVVGFALATTVIYTFWQGRHALVHLNFYTKDMGGVQPATDPLNKGGALHAIVGTFLELGVAVAVSLPLGIAAAVYMTEVGGRLSKVVRTVVEAMTALPDLLAGLFVYATLILTLGFQLSGFAAAVALSITMLPIIARSSELALRVVPGGLREAGLALGSTRWRTVRRVILPTAAPGLATALILAFARAVGETAPVLIVSGASGYMNFSLTHNPMNSLPLFVYEGIRSGQPLWIARGFGAASILLAIVLIVFVIIRFIARGPNRRAR